MREIDRLSDGQRFMLLFGHRLNDEPSQIDDDHDDDDHDDEPDFSLDDLEWFERYPHLAD
jgi:hypothetical protein